MQNHTFEMSAQMRACGTEHKARDCKALSSSHPQTMVHMHLLSPFGILLQGTSFPLLYIQRRDPVTNFARKKGAMNRCNRPSQEKLSPSPFERCWGEVLSFAE